MTEFNFSKQVNLDKLKTEIQNSAIIVALDYLTAIGPSTTVVFKNDLSTEEEALLNAVVEAHVFSELAPEVTKVSLDVAKTSKGFQKVAMYEPEGQGATVVSHNFADKCSWYQHSSNATFVVMETSDNLTFTDPEERTHWIDLDHGRLYDENNIMRTCDYKYRPLVWVDDELKLEDIKYLDGTVKTLRDYSIDYETGAITFHTEQTGEVKATFYYANKSYYSLRPKQNKTLSIRTTETQFSHTTAFKTAFVFEAWFVGHPIYGTMKVPSTAIYYKNAKDFISACNEGQGLIPKWGELTEDVHVFPFEYARPKPFKFSDFMELRIYTEEHLPVQGEYATATFYVTIDDEIPQIPSGGPDMSVRLIHGTHTFAQEYNHNDTLNLVGIPANARITSVKIQQKAVGFLWSSVQAEFHIGTIAVPDAFSNGDQQGNPYQPSAIFNSFMEYVLWYKESIATYMALKFFNSESNPTTNLTGKTIEYWIEYVQE